MEPTFEFNGCRILVTGAGGPAGYSVLERLAARCPGLVLHAADASPLASGLFVVPETRRHVVPFASDAAFGAALERLCTEQRIDLVIPTVDGELLPLSLARTRLGRQGTRVAVSTPAGLRVCADKVNLTETLAPLIPTAPTVVWTGQCLPEALTRGRLVAKPREGSGARGVHVVDGSLGLAPIPTDGSYLVMEHLPGPEYSVDVFRATDGRVLAAVPRERLRVDSGVAIAARTVHDTELESYAARAVEALCLTGTLNVQFRRDFAGRPRLLEINPRFPGTMPLTIAAGVDMPWLTVLDAFEGCATLEPMGFEEVAIVRRWREQVVDVDSLVPRDDAESLLVAEVAE
ncbi:MAG: ATP-grasp domain-containing protein [Nannocystales bacterium]